MGLSWFVWNRVPPNPLDYNLFSILRYRNLGDFRGISHFQTHPICAGWVPCHIFLVSPLGSYIGHANFNFFSRFAAWKIGDWATSRVVTHAMHLAYLSVNGVIKDFEPPTQWPLQLEISDLFCNYIYIYIYYIYIYIYIHKIIYIIIYICYYIFIIYLYTSICIYIHWVPHDFAWFGEELLFNTSIL